MAEMILPGTYIEVRSEGLIVPGPISIGNVGIVGTARRGKLGNPPDGDPEPPKVYTPADIGEARDIFGQYDAFDNPTESNKPLTLVRALDLAYSNGAQRVFAVRVAANAAATKAVYTFGAGSGAVKAESKAPGSGYNIVDPDREPFEAQTAASGSGLDVTFTLGRIRETWRDVPAAAADFTRVINGKDPVYKYASLSSSGGGSNLFTLDVADATGDIVPGKATLSVKGTDGASASADDYAQGLAALLNEDVQIVVLGGEGFAETGGMHDKLVAHVQNCSTDLIKRERIGLIGHVDPKADLVHLEGPNEDEGRLVFVGPGIKVTDAVSGREVTLPGSYAAAAVAGKISSLDPHVSPTNKTINASNLQKIFNGTELEQLVLRRVLALEKSNGSIRIVKGITTSTNTAFSQITTRRIVDYARFGVRASCQPFIGKLNNDRVRQAMKGTINGFLAEMLDREMLISYNVDVSATREQQIRGIAVVTLILQPTFSIDYIRVVMYLQ